MASASRRDGETRSASIRDVAELAGVSPGTASKALNRRGTLRPETVQRVLSASQKLGYRPNELVRGIFGSRSFTVGLITSDSFGRFSGPVMAGAGDALDSGKLSVIMCDSHGDAEREQRHLATLLGRRIDGLLVTGRCSNPRPPIAASLPFPVVYAHTPSTDPRDCSVMVGVIDALRAVGVSVPQDIAVLGTDNWALIARAARPPLTTVDMGLDYVGRRAAHFLIDAIDGRSIAGRHVAPAGLVVRASTGLPYLDPDADAPRSYHDFCIHEPAGSG